MGEELTRAALEFHARALYDFCPYPAVRYNILFRTLGVPYEDERLAKLRPAFLASDIVEEMFETQDRRGGWGRLMAKDYSVKARIPTSAVGISRCLMIGLTADDRDILPDAAEYLRSVIDGSGEAPFEKNERAVPWQTAAACGLLEDIYPGSRECDRTVDAWQYIANRAYESGEYSYERDRDAQHEVFRTREARLVPMQCGLILKRRGGVSPEIEDAMLRHLGGEAARSGHFWDKTPGNLPPEFRSKQTRRWMHTFNYINQFRGSALYLADAVRWLMEQAGADGLWDWGPQTKDPWGYFGYFSLNRNYGHNRTVDCTLEILRFLRRYLENNSPEHREETE